MTPLVMFFTKMSRTLFVSCPAGNRLVPSDSKAIKLPSASTDGDELCPLAFPPDASAETSIGAGDAWTRRGPGTRVATTTAAKYTTILRRRGRSAEYID